MNEPVRTLVDGLVFPEGPRWHAGRLWFSDMEDMCVKAVDPDGTVEEIVRIDDYTSGLGWLPDGRLLVVAVKTRRLLAVDRAGNVSLHADLGPVTRSFANDMIVDRSGRAYVGSMGYDIWSDPEPKPGALAIVEPDGTARLAVEEMMFPNGAAITPDGRKLIVAESLSKVLTAFEIADDGSLSARRIWRETADVMPDGMCLDAEGGAWIASITDGAFLRLDNDGKVTHRMETPDDRQAWAVALGGDMLYMLSSSPLGDTRENRLATRPGRIEMMRAPVPAPAVSL